MRTLTTPTAESTPSHAIVVYGAGMLQGFAFTLVPALATVFAAAPYNINARGFGILFIPLTVGAIIGAALTPKLAAKTDTVMVLRIGVVANAAALVALLIASRTIGAAAYVLLLIDTTALGLGFGLNFSAVNELASHLSANETASVTIANVLTGLGTSLTPIILGAFIFHHAWAIWPGILLAAFIVIFVSSLRWHEAKSTSSVATPSPSRTLIAFGIAALLYAFCEGTFSSWATTFAHLDRGFSLATGEAALTAFWLALTLTRLFAAFATRVLTPKIAIVIFPILIAAAFFFLPLWRTPTTLVIGFALGGIACSIVFPFAMSLALGAMPSDADRVAGVMVAALMTGEGFGTFFVGALHADAHVSLAAIYRAAAVVALALAIAATLARSASPERALNRSS
ncbi:MAG: hypothetical protein JO024_01150 [Candidatus Eremiobacteraeota bacterium]|nr:hypothetical protein [Candidatus Eremiobacteraeota bacterium]